MVEILPAILEKSFGPIAEKVDRLRGVASRAQLDLMDGQFVPDETWHEQERFTELGEDIKFDLHLMVAKPELWIARWDYPAIFRIAFHQEATYDVLRTAALIRAHGKEVGLALKIETPVAVVYDIIEAVDMVLLMAVNPGGQGRQFDGRVIDKIKELKQHSPKVKIGVDGGVTPLVASSLIAAGADVLVSGSYLFSQSDIREAIKSLQV